MRKILIFISVALLLNSWSAIAVIPPTAAQRTIEEIADDAVFRTAQLGVFAVTVSGDTLASYNREVKMVPASNVKLISTGLALRYLGEDFKFRTYLAHSGEIVEGILKGDLYIIGGGDPTIGSKAACAQPSELLFAEWAKMLKEAGVKKIEGRIVGDPRYFDSAVPENMGWSYDDLGTYYGAAPTGLSYFENQKNYLITPGVSVGDKPNIEPRHPETPWMQYLNTASTGPVRSANTLFCVNTALAPRAQFAGDFPVDRKAYTLESSNRFGAYTCAYHFLQYLKSQGIETLDACLDVDYDGKLRDVSNFSIHGPAAAPEQLDTIGCSYSPRLFEIVRDTNWESDNFFAETLLKILAKSVLGSCRSELNVETAEMLLSRYGVPMKGRCQLFDGSGLSRKNYISAEYFVDFLSMMWQSDSKEAYLRSLPEPGKRGTLEYKFMNSPQEFKSRIKMKSGSMNGVRCYSGYILSSDGDPNKTIVFSLLSNNVIEKSWMVNPQIDRIIEALAAEN